MTTSPKNIDKASRLSYADLCQTRLLRQAWNLVRRGGPAPGVDGRSLEQFAANADLEIARIQHALQTHRFRFLPYRRVFIAKLTGGKRRLAIPSIRDRLVAQALRILLQPLLSRNFEPASFAYCSGKGVQQAIDRLLQLCRHGSPWVLESDIQDFFDSIDLRLLLDRLRREPIDPQILQLLTDSLTSGVHLGKRWFPSPRGVPQGSPLSPLLANYYLTPFDRVLQQAGHQLIRYADDLVICSTSRAEAQNALTCTTQTLAKLHLKIQHQKTRILDSRREGFEFLGFAIHPHRILPTADNLDRFLQQLQQLLLNSRSLPTHIQLQKLNTLILCFAHFYRRCHDDPLWHNLDLQIQDLWTQHLRLNQPKKPKNSTPKNTTQNIVSLVAFRQTHPSMDTNPPKGPSPKSVSRRYSWGGYPG